MVAYVFFDKLTAISAKMNKVINSARATKRIVFVAYDGCQSLDITGPWEVFFKANQFYAQQQASQAAQQRVHAYRLTLVSALGGTVVSNSGLVLGNAVPLANMRGSIHTVLVAGGSEHALQDPLQVNLLVPWLKRKADTVQRMGSVCTGAFALAQAGLLNGRQATTHWSACARMALLYPRVVLQPDAIFVADPPYYTSAGITAGIDLALALVEADLGSAIALAVARDLVLFLRRPGGQSQFSGTLQGQGYATGQAGQALATHKFQDLLVWIAGHPRADLGVQALAARVTMSERNFARLFKKMTGTTPAKHVETVRVDAAKASMERTHWPLARVAQQAGFGSVDSLQRSLRRHTKITAAQYRQRYGVVT